jgi:HipA-like kinase
LLINAVQHVRRMRGGAQSHMMRCADGNYYVVKFQNNPQHTRVLVNDWLGTRLGEMIGLPMPAVAVVDVHPWLVEHTPELRWELCGQRKMMPAGLSFGSRYVVAPTEGQVFDYLPEAAMAQVRNVRDFAGALALDKWTCNANGRQAAFWKKGRERKFTVSFIDQGYCFNAGEWSFPDAPLRGVFGRNDVYACVTGWPSFEPWLSRIENFPESSVWALAEEIPPEWYGGEMEDLQRLLSKLLERRLRVRELVLEFRNTSRNPFPNWKEVVN